MLDARFTMAIEETDKLLALAKPAGKTVLDLGCGLGRFAIALAQRGYKVTGVDRTKLYLETAREKAQLADLRIEWVQADMRDFVRPRSCDLVLSMLTSLGYFDDKREDLLVVENMFVNLRPGGVCLIDMMGKEVLARIGQPTTSEVFPDGTWSVVRHRIVDGWTRIQNEWMFVRNGRAKVYRFHHTIYSGQELRQLMEQAGFIDVQLYGNLDGEEYGVNAHRLIAVGRKPASDGSVKRRPKIRRRFA